MSAPTSPQSREATDSCRSQLTIPSGRRFYPKRTAMLSGNCFALAGQRVQTPARTVFAGWYVRIFPPADEQPHLFEPREGAVERPVRGQKPGIRVFPQVFGQFVAVKFRGVSARERPRRRTDRKFERKQLTGFSSHGPYYKQIYAYKANGEMNLESEAGSYIRSANPAFSAGC